MKKSLLSTFRLGRKDDDAAGASGGSNSPFGGRKAEKEKEAAASSLHPFGPPPRRSGAESQSSSSLPTTAKEGEGSAPNSPFTQRRRSSLTNGSERDMLSPSGTREESEADDTESSTSSTSQRRLSSEMGTRASSEGPPTPGTPQLNAPSQTAAPAAAAPGKVVVIISQNGQSHEFEYTADWQVRAVFANIATKLTVDKNSSLYHPNANVFLEAQRDLQCYWDCEPEPLTLAFVSGGRPTCKEVKVRVGQIKRSVLVLKTTTAGGAVMAAGDDSGFRPTQHVLLVADKPVAPSTVVWKMIGPEWAVVPVADLPPVNLRVNFVDEQVFKVLKVAAGTQIRGMIDACRKKWIVKMQDGGAAVEYGFWLREDGEWLADNVPAYSLTDRPDLEFKRRAAAATDASSAVGGAAQASVAVPSASAAPATAATPLTEKAKKARREKVDKDVALFLQRRPPNSAPSTIRNDATKRKPIECNLNYDVIDFCLGFLEKHNVLDLEGIYRISGNSDTVRHVWAAFCLGYFDYLDWQDAAGEIAHVVTGACKLYLRELEVPLLPWDTHQRFLACEAIADPEAKLVAVLELVNQLNAVSQHTLRRLMFHLWEVAGHEKVNRMSPNNLAIVFGPTIMRPEVQDIAEMLNNATKVDLCTYMILNREKLFDLEKLKPLTERTLGPMPVLDESKPAKQASRKVKTAKPSVDEPAAVNAEPTPPAVVGQAAALAAKSAAAREPKKSSIGSALQGATSRKASSNPRGYSDALQAMTAELLPEVVAGCMVFLRQMEVDPKAFRKHLKGLPPDQLIDMIQNLAKHVAAAPSATGTTRAVKTISVGGTTPSKPTAAVPAAATTVVPAATPVSTTTASAAAAATAAPTAAAPTAAAPTAAATAASASVDVASEQAPPRPSRPPPSLAALEQQGAVTETSATALEGDEVEEVFDTEDIMAAVAAGIAASASAAIEDDDSPVKEEPVPGRERSLSIVDLTVGPEEEEEIVIGATGAANDAAPGAVVGAADAGGGEESDEEIVIGASSANVAGDDKAVPEAAEVVTPAAHLESEGKDEPKPMPPPVEAVSGEGEAAALAEVAVVGTEAAVSVTEKVSDALDTPVADARAADEPEADGAATSASEPLLSVQGDLLNALNALSGADAAAEEVVAPPSPPGQSESDSDDLVE